MLPLGVAPMWHERSKMGPFWPLFFELAASVCAHHILKEIVVRVGVALRAARVFMTKPFAYAIEPGTVVVEP